MLSFYRLVVCKCLLCCQGWCVLWMMPIFLNAEQKLFFLGYYPYEDELGTINYIYIYFFFIQNDQNFVLVFGCPFICKVPQLGSYFEVLKKTEFEGSKVNVHRFHKRINGPRHCWNYIYNNNIYFISNELILSVSSSSVWSMFSDFLKLMLPGLILVIEFFYVF